jgi:hypothetical protein
MTATPTPATTSSGKDSGDMSGTIISSDKPVSFTGGTAYQA